MTTALGLVAATIARFIEPSVRFFAPLTSGILVVIGLIYMLQGEHRERGHGHDHKPMILDKATTVSLFLMLTFSPCEAMIPIFFIAGPLGRNALTLLSLLVTTSTIGGMIVLIYLTALGYERIHFKWLDRNEKRVIGILLLILGAFSFFYPT